MVGETPFLQPYSDALSNALSHILENYHLTENNNSSYVFEEAALIFLSSANITLPDISLTWGNTSAISETVLSDLINDAIKLMIKTEAFGDSPIIYQIMEQLLASNGTNLIVESFFEMFMWLTSTEATAPDLLSQAPLKLYNLIRPILYVFTRLFVSDPEDLVLYEDFATNIFSEFSQFVSTIPLLPLGHQEEIMFQSEEAGAPTTARVRRKRDLSMMTTAARQPQPLEDIFNMLSIDYSTLYGAALVPPTSAEVMETAHIFFGNPNLNKVMKGATSDMQWSYNASQEDTIDAALGVASFLTHPQVLEK